MLPLQYVATYFNILSLQLVKHRLLVRGLCRAPATLCSGMPRTPRGRRVAPHPRELRAPRFFGWCPHRSSPRRRLDFVARLLFLPVVHAKLLPCVYFPYCAIFEEVVRSPNITKWSGVGFSRLHITQVQWWLTSCTDYIS